MSALRFSAHPKRTLFLLCLIAALLLAAWHYLGRMRTDLAQVEGKIYTVSSEISAPVTEILVEENQAVVQGQILMKLDPKEAELDLVEAQAVLAALKSGQPVPETSAKNRQEYREKEKLIKSQITKARQAETDARQALEQASTQHAQSLFTLRGLNAQGVASNAPRHSAATQAVEEAAQKLNRSRQNFEAQSQQRVAIENSLKSLQGALSWASGAMSPAARREAILAQEKRVEKARRALAATNIIAPSQGFVTRLVAETGTQVNRGTPLMAIIPLSADSLWITAMFSECAVTQLSEGQACTVSFPAYPDFKLQGTVQSLPAATEDSLSLSPRAHTPNMPVRIRLDAYDPESMPRLRIGMSAEVSMNAL